SPSGGTCCWFGSRLQAAQPEWHRIELLLTENRAHLHVNRFAPLGRKVFPCGILAFDQRHFLFAPPVLELLLAANGRVRPVKTLEVNQPMYSVVAGKSAKLSAAVFAQARPQTAGDPD